MIEEFIFNKKDEFIHTHTHTIQNLISIKIPISFFTEIGYIEYTKVCMELRKTQRTQTIQKEKIMQQGLIFHDASCNKTNWYWHKKSIPNCAIKYLMKIPKTM